MKKKPAIIFSVIVCVILVIDMIQIKRLKQEVGDLQNSLNYQSQRTEDIYYNAISQVNAMLEEEDNQLTKSDWEYGKVDVDSHTVQIICTVIPKEYTPGTTQAYLVCAGREFPMTFADDHFTATAEIPLFTNTESFLVKLVDGETVRTQELDWYLNPRYDVMPSVSVQMGGYAQGIPGKEEYDWSIDETVTVDVNYNGKFQIQSVEIVAEIDGREVDRIPVDISAEGQYGYYQDAEKDGVSFAIPEEQNGPDYDGSAHFLYPLKKEFRIPNGSVMVLYVDVVDGDGIRYRCCLDAVAIGENGEPDRAYTDENIDLMIPEPIAIYDKAGNEIYKMEDFIN